MTRTIQGWSLLPLAGLTTVIFLSCMATPPQEVLAFDGGRVRAADAHEAVEVEGLLRELRPALLALLPDTEFQDLDVWVQDQPSLYRFPTEATADAEGLWSPSHRRIMLSRNADDVRRTLAHELVHASLGTSWRALPGTMEEGLADHASTHLAEDGAARLRAGRLSAAALAVGGLELVLSVERDHGKNPDVRRSWSARIRLSGDESDPLDVFQLSAGLSTTKLATGPKRGYYGLAFLVVDRIVERHGYAGLNKLCTKASENGLTTVPAEWLLAAAELTRDVTDWRRAAHAALGESELIELVGMYPDFLVDALVAYVKRQTNEGSAEHYTTVLAGLDVNVTLAADDTHAATRVSLAQLPSVREAVEARLASDAALGQLIADS